MLIFYDFCSYWRHCVKEYKYKDITIPKNSIVDIPSTLLHMDPQYWKDPETFDPMRSLNKYEVSALSALFSDSQQRRRPSVHHSPTCPLVMGPGAVLA